MGGRRGARTEPPAGQTTAATDADPRAVFGDREIDDNTRVLAEDGDTYEELDGVGDEAYAGDAVGGVLVRDAGITVTPIGTDANDRRPTTSSSTCWNCSRENA